ncbi:LuxR family transcriptional regulator [Streptomyces cyaneogriseus subsp. noncyanogenus]|jgi:two-component system response regulator DesR|uniref:LuxR family transcriptional regulator n=1 Tax=Streptomyces cyaneogriseus subsp. noncyanogenus TaxID=477245 RepID=A0A0C5FKX1_9ACTN|nr:response regulator transcription factor [Streptomyces cyaneogriseus]AJP00382.1 LuxR family transcriptional regulator [Streptomyces cyaneogriseus subsp. noncyanogenus]
MTRQDAEIRLVLADDEGLLREALSSLLDLEHDMSVVGSARTGAEAVAVVAEQEPDLVVLDLEMPEMDGIEAAKAILSTRSVPIVIVTRHARPATLRRALQAGVRGFVPKATPAAQFLKILRDVHGGARYVDPEIAASALVEDPCPLSQRELELLALARPGTPVSEIAERTSLSEGTVRNYLSSATIKLNARTRHEAAHLAWSEGWI